MSAIYQPGYPSGLDLRCKSGNIHRFTEIVIDDFAKCHEFLQASRLAMIAYSPKITFVGGGEIPKLTLASLERLGGVACYSDTEKCWSITFPSGALKFHKYKAKGAYHVGKSEDDKRTVCGYINKQDHRCVCDVGAGEGTWTKMIDRAFGVDRDVDAVMLSKQVGATVVLGDAYWLDAYDFDAVLLADAFEHLPFVDEFVWLTKKKCDDFYIVNPEPKGSGYHFSEFEHDDLQKWFESRHFGTVHREKLGPAKEFFHFRAKK